MKKSWPSLKSVNFNNSCNMFALTFGEVAQLVHFKEMNNELVNSSHHHAVVFIQSGENADLLRGGGHLNSGVLHAR